MGSHTRKQSRVIHALERHGWRVLELEDSDSWLLESMWAPIGAKVHLSVDHERITHRQSTNWSPGVLKLDSLFDKRLPTFLSYLNRVRQSSRFYPDGEFSVGGVTIGMTEPEVKKIHGKPTDRSVFYANDYHADLGHRDFVRVQHTYPNLTVTYYHCEGELVVCRIYGSTLELDGRYYLNTGEPQTRLEELFERLPWEDRPRHFSPPGWANWWYYGPSVYVDRFGKITEFRLGTHQGPFGRMMELEGD